MSNAPLFVLAAPMLLIVALSTNWAKPLYDDAWYPANKEHHIPQIPVEKRWMSPVGMGIARCLAIPQSILAILALTTYHVQVITRISSAYPLWYWWLAWKIVSKDTIRVAGFNMSAKVVVRWMVLYALIQASLFAAFLPPA